MKILIVGAGLGGLAAAYCFAKDGHHVFERREKLSPKGSGLLIRPGASRILQSWGLGDAIEQVADTCLPILIRDLKTGKDKIRTLPASLTKYPDWGIHRPILQDILYQHAVHAGAEIFFNSSVEDFSDEPGEFETCVWAGDERFVIGRKPRKMEFWSGLFGLKHDDGHASMWSEDGDIAFVRQRFEGICPPLSAVLKLATKCDRWKIAQIPNLPRWTSRTGRTILLGDSAHAMEPNAAQGLSQTIEDIGVLHILLSSLPYLSVAVISRFWEDIRKPRVERIKSFAAWNTQRFLGHKDHAASHQKYADTDWDSIKNIEPDPAADFRSPAFFKWAHDYDVVEHVSLCPLGSSAFLGHK
ncbi:hypothetical protein AtubIFM57143_001496 [Aspergillus tubingensis]|nr:hypothetical protein AtubIFM57143_001496 [Aspergillus tubingensis]